MLRNTISNKKIYNNMFSRNLLVLSQVGQEKIRKTPVAVIGLGGVGSVVCELLVRSGIVNIITVARGAYELGNINRQIPATYINVLAKIPKVHAMSERLLRINPFCKIKVLRCNVTKNEREILKAIVNEKVRIIFNCVDELQAQLSVAKIARDAGAFMLIGGVVKLGTDGIVTVFKPNGVTYEMIFKINRRVGTETEIKRYWIDRNKDSMPRWLLAHYHKNIKTPYPVLTPIPWLVSSFLVTEAIKLITKVGKPIFAPKFIFIRGLKPSIEIVDVSKEEIFIDDIIPWRP